MFFRHFHDHDRHGHGEPAEGGSRPTHARRRLRPARGPHVRRRRAAARDPRAGGRKPRYGYEIIKALGERVGGDYSPSPASSIPRSP